MIRRFVIVLAVFASPLFAQEESLIHLKGGRFYHVVILSSTWEYVEVRYTPEEGEAMTVKVKVADLDAYYFYGVRNKAIGRDANERIKLAKWCVDNDMFSRAKAQMDMATAADPKAVEEFMKTEFPKIKEGIAAKLLRAAKRSLQRGSTTNAKKYASYILTKFEGTAVEAEAETVLDEANRREEAKAAKRRQKRADRDAKEAKRAENKENRTRQSELGPIEKRLSMGRQDNVRGLKAKNLSQAKSGFEAAASNFKQAIINFDALPQDLKSGNEAMREEAVAGGVRADLSLAHSMSARGSYVEGTKYCNLALAIDPDNAEAKSARATIATTAGGWGRRGRR